MLKRALVYFVLMISFLSSSYAQKTFELGVFIGRSYYLGEVNPKTHWGNGVGSLNLGGIARYNLNKRYSLKATLIRTTLSAKDENMEFPFNNSQRLASFETKLTEIATSIEFNFLPYATGDKTHFFSPYLFVGLSYYGYDPIVKVEGFSPQPIDESKGRGLALPFGPGFKLSLGGKVTLSLEWGFRKTSTDLLDGLENTVGDIFESGKDYDNDWFVVSGFMLTYKLTDEGSCPAYNF